MSMHYELKDQTDLQLLDHAFIKGVVHSLCGPTSSQNVGQELAIKFPEIHMAPDVPANCQISRADFQQGLCDMKQSWAGCDGPGTLSVYLIYGEQEAYLQVIWDDGYGASQQFTIGFKLDLDADATLSDCDKGGKGWSSLAPLRLLLVEDDPVNRQFFQTLFTVHGHQVTQAESGQRAIDLLQAAPEKYDLILMDVEMPVMKGTEAAETIKQLPVPIAHIPVVGLTAHTDQSIRQACLKSGMISVFTKPLEEEKCVAEIRRILSDHTFAV